MKVEVIYGPDAFPLRRAYEHDAGWDIAASQFVQIPPFRYREVKTDVRINVPPGYATVIWSRSSTFKKGLLVYKGLIDPGYQGEVVVLVYNLFKRYVVLSKGEYFAQLVFIPFAVPEFKVVEEFSPSVRGTRGFGSSGRFANIVEGVRHERKEDV